MTKKTKDLPLIKRVLAKLITKAQITILKPAKSKILGQIQAMYGFKVYMKLAALHYRLHYGEKLTSKSAQLDLAAKRSVRLFFKVNAFLLEENQKTINFYTDLVTSEFKNNVPNA